MNYRNASKSDLSKIESLLKENKLPYADCQSQLNNFIVLHNQNDIYGIAAAELYGKVALLRSVVVETAYRGKGLGASIYSKIQDFLSSKNVETVYLLTETAEDYFTKFGFNAIKRDLAPDSIKQTTQFSSLCPSSAAVMRKNI